MGEQSRVVAAMRTLVSFLILVSLLSGGLSIPWFPEGADAALTVDGGTIVGDVTWSSSDSPVTVTDNITVAAGSSLTISPGVTVQVADGKWIEVLGTLEAVGTPSSRIRIQGVGAGGFDRINISSGGRGMMDLCDIDSDRGAAASGTGSTLRIYNSTMMTPSSGVSSLSGAEVWTMNCTFNSPTNVSVSGGVLHEGNWLMFRAMKDNGAGPYQGAKLKVTATKPQGSDWTIFDHSSGDPATGPDGRLPPIPVEQYLHESIVSIRKVMVTLKMTAEDNRWSDQVSPVYMGSDLHYTWWMDLTPPVAPTNLTVLHKGAHHIKIAWNFEGDPTEVKYFIVEHKKSWQADTEWVVEEPGPSTRDWNITNLDEEIEYDIRLSCIDGSDNPSDVLGPIQVKTYDVTLPLPPTNLTVQSIGGHFAELSWNISDSEDVTSYRIYLNDSSGKKTRFVDVPAEEADDDSIQEYNLTGLADETSYLLWVDAIDDGEIPNNSSGKPPIRLTTLDITPPPAPTLEPVFVDPEQYLNGSGFYNGTQIALRGVVEGENRTFIDVFVDGELYVSPNPALPRPATFEGEFFFFIQVDEGSHRIKVRSVDPGGNVGPFSDVHEVTVDRTLPRIGPEVPRGTIEVDEGEAVVIDSNTTDENGVHEISWHLTGEDGTRTLTGDLLDTTFELGNHTVELVVRDMAGNINRSFFKVISLVPDDTPPLVTVMEPETDEDLDHAPEFVIAFNEPVLWELLDAWVEGTEDGSDVRIELLTEYDPGNSTARYQLTRSLRGGHEYTLVVGNIVDLRDNRAEDLRFRFFTIEDDRIDSDSDGMPDVFEVQMPFLNPSDPSDADEDEDGDGLTNVEEYDLGTDLESKDSDGDEMEDGWEVEHGFSPLDRSDALQDADGDGFTNLDEYRANTDPLDEKDFPESSESGDGGLIIALVVLALVVIVTVVVVVFIIIKKRSPPEDEGFPDGTESAAGTPVSWSEQEEEMKNECPTCGASLEAGMDYCPDCGTVIPAKEEATGSDLVEGPITDVPSPDEEVNEDEEMEEDLYDDLPPPEENEGPGFREEGPPDEQGTGKEPFS